MIAVSTAIVESQLRNVGYGDRDSLGLFQQRPSQGWGVPRELLNPVLAAGKFYDALLAVPAGRCAPPASRPRRCSARRSPSATHRSNRRRPPWSPASGSARTSPRPGAAAATASRRRGAHPGLPRSGRCGAAAGGGPAIDPARLPPGYTLPADPVQRAVVASALDQVGKPYVWGAKGPAAFDCSGLTQAAWAAAGVPISAGTLNQIRDGTPVADLGRLAPGDLLFIPGSFGTTAVPRHVGLYIGVGLVVDARSTRRGVIISSIADWRRTVVAVRHIGGPSEPPTAA